MADEARDYLVWSGEREAWWMANERGYTTDLPRAGWYTKSEAEANRGAQQAARRPPQRGRAGWGVPGAVLGRPARRGAVMTVMTRDQVNELAWRMYQEAMVWRRRTAGGKQQALDWWQRTKSVRAFYRRLARAALAHQQRAGAP